LGHRRGALPTALGELLIRLPPGRSPHMAMRKVWPEINEGNLWI
jgi:hypothetical protein